MASPVQQTLVPSKTEKLALLRGLLREQNATFHERDQQNQIPLHSTSVSALLDGIPTDEIIQISGPKSSGKTTLALQMVTELSRNGLYCAIIDETGRLFPPALEDLGADVQRVLFVTPPPPRRSSKQNLLLWSTEQSIDSGIFSVILVLSQRTMNSKIQLRLQRACARAQTALLLIADSETCLSAPGARIRIEVHPTPSDLKHSEAPQFAAPDRQLRCTLHLRNRPATTMMTFLPTSNAEQKR